MELAENAGGRKILRTSESLRADVRLSTRRSAGKRWLQMTAPATTCHAAETTLRTRARKIFFAFTRNSSAGLLHRGFVWPNIRAALRGVVPLVTSSDGRPDPWRCKAKTEMKNRNGSNDSDPGPRLRKVNEYLEKNFPDFFAEARFQVGEDDYFLYARFGQYLARAIEKSRAPRNKINRGFTVLNKMARASAKDPGIRQILVSGPLEYIVDAPKARALARKRLSPVAQSYMEGLCE